MKPWIVGVLVAACSSPVTSVTSTPSVPKPVSPVQPPPPARVSRPSPPPPAPPPAPVALSIDADTAADAPLPPHACTRALYPDGMPAPMDGEYEGRGRTIDELGEEVAKTTPIAGTCDVRLRERTENAILSASPAAALKTSTAWDHQGTVAFYDRVLSALAITDDEQRQLVRDGMVVPARLGYEDYSSAYYDIHRAQLPIYISADSVLHAIYASHDHLLAKLENEVLVDRLDRALGRMHCALGAAAKEYPPEVAEDLDVYLTVARRLLSGNDVPPQVSGRTAERAEMIVNAITIAQDLETITLFGRERAFDASAYLPRGHYDGELAPYFRAAMWLSRMEFNLVSRDTRSSQPGYRPDPSETPREAVDALALADLADRSAALPDLATIDRAWSAFAGGREDISLGELAKLRKKLGKLTIPASAVALRAAIGDRFQRRVNVFPNPNVAHLPAIATVLGPRITPDLAMISAIPRTPEPDVAASELGYALGHDRALAYVPKTVARADLDAARAALAHAAIHDDLYGEWLDAIRALAHPVKGTQPSFMSTAAFADLRLDSALASYGQLRHNNVLIAAQVYDVGGCEIPDGYVEPVPEVYDALAKWAKDGERIFKDLDPKQRTGGAAYFARANHLITVLAAISRHELANRPLSADEKRFLAMAVEMREASAWNYNGEFPVPTYDGWYLDLFPSTEVAFHEASFIADYETHDYQGMRWVDYLGAKGPHLGLFVIDSNGAPRLAVGPVASAYAATGPITKRYTDATAKDAEARAPWAASYTVAAPSEPSFAIVAAHAVANVPKGRGSFDRRRHLEGLKISDGKLAIIADHALGDVTIELRDHHFVKIGELKLKAGAGRTEVELPATAGVESLLVHAGTWAGRVDLDLQGIANHTFGLHAP